MKSTRVKNVAIVAKWLKELIDQASTGTNDRDLVYADVFLDLVMGGGNAWAAQQVLDRLAKTYHVEPPVLEKEGEIPF